MLLRHDTGCVRSRGVLLYVACFATIALTTECLSLAKSITQPFIMGAWGVGMAFYALAQRSRTPRAWHPFRVWPPFSRQEKWLLAITCGIAGLLLAIGLAAPPTTYDAHTYHLPRVYHWIRQSSVDFYATANSRQNYMQPLAEYAMLHLRLLTGSDRLFNLVQWSGFLASLGLVSLLARECGLTRRGQLLATAIAATIPMAILQATSCQNDLFAASFCLALTYGLIRLTSPTGTARDAWLCGLALGCALLAKGTSYIFCLPILLIFGLRHLTNLRSQAWRPLVTRWALIAGLALVINAGLYARNLGVYGHPLGAAQSHVTPPHISGGTTFDNLLRNLGAHLATPLPAWNHTMERVVTRLTNNSETFGGYPFTLFFELFEDNTGNLLHLLLALGCLSMLPFLRANGRRDAAVLAEIVVGVGILLSALLLWQPWGVRFHVFLFLLLAPVLAWVLERAPRLIPIVTLGLALYAIPYLFLNVSRPVISLHLMSRFAPPAMRELLQYRPSVFLVPRLNQYFGRNTAQRQDYEGALHWLPQDPTTPVGLLTGGDDPEFRLWALADQTAGHLPNFIPLASDTPRLLPPLHLHPAIIFDTRPVNDRPPPAVNYTTPYQTRQITVWKRIDASPH